MEFFEAVAKRRSIRRFTNKPVPEVVMRKAFEAAVLAPNSSNAQTWDFYWVRSAEKKAALVKACFNQSAARTAAELVVIVASPTSWKRSWPQLKKYVHDINAPPAVKTYYERLVPWMYRWGFLNSIGLFKWLAATPVGFFRPTVRGPFSRHEVQTVSIKSAALAAENFVLAITAQGYATCMMEGHDEFRVKRLIKLKCSDRVVMVIGVGEEAERGTWGPRFRVPNEQVIHEV
jgi:nitroreductase